jgi:predicted kinase
MVMPYREAMAAAEDLAQTEPRIVFMMCGLAGSGKTTFAKRLEALGCQRFSIDEEIWRHDGRFGIDFPEAAYADLQAAAETRLRLRLEDQLMHGTKAVIDFAFWNGAARTRYRELIEARDHRCCILYLQVEEAILRDRLRERSARRDANAAFPITDDLLAKYVQGFEFPSEQEAWIVQATFD